MYDIHMLQANPDASVSGKRGKHDRNDLHTSLLFFKIFLCDIKLYCAIHMLL